MRLLVIPIFFLAACGQTPCGELAAVYGSGLSYKVTGNHTAAMFDGTLAMMVANSACIRMKREKERLDGATVHVINSEAEEG